MNRKQASDIDHELAVSEDNMIVAKNAYRKLLDEKNNIYAQLKIDREHESNRDMIKWLGKDEQNNRCKIEAVKETVAELDAFIERHQKLTSRERIIRERLPVLDINDGIEKILYDKLTNEKKSIDSELDEMNELIDDAKNDKERKSKLVKALEEHSIFLLSMIKDCEVDADYVSDLNIKKSWADINAKVKAAENEIFAALESHRKLIAKYNEKLKNDTPERRVSEKRSLSDSDDEPEDDESEDDGPKRSKYDN